MADASLGHHESRSLEPVDLAFSFAKIARRDARASMMLYRGSFIPQAVFEFQQSVEKDAKAIGLLMGFLKPTSDDVRKVSHLSLLGLLLRMPEMLERLPALQDSVRKELDKPQLKTLGLPKLFEPILKPPATNGEMVRMAIRQIRSVNRSMAWGSTLSFDSRKQLTRSIRKMLGVAEQRCKEADEAELIVRRLRRLVLKRFGLSIDNYGTKFFLNVGVRAIQEAVPLTLITMWHESETRYPPVSKEDYWDVDKYTKERGLIRALPELYQHLDRLTASTIKGARAAIAESEGRA